MSLRQRTSKPFRIKCKWEDIKDKINDYYDAFDEIIEEMK